MSASIVRVLAAAVAASLLGVALLMAGARWGLPDDGISGPIAEGGWTQRSRAAFVSTGFSGAERDPGSGRYFSWATPQARIDFPHLNRARAHRVTLAVRGGRPAGAPRAQARIAVDGELALDVAVANEPAEIVFEIPRAGRAGASVSIDVSPVFTPGGADPRALGIIVDAVRVQVVNGAFVPAPRVLGLAALAVFLAVLGLEMPSRESFSQKTTPGLAIVGVPIAAAWLLLQDAAFIGGYAERLVRISLAVLVAGGIVGLARRRWPVIGGAPDWALAAGLAIAVSAFKVAVFWHPLAPVGDGIFQVHRAMVVHGGEWFFTSVTPKPFFEFPYPVALYVFAQPFWDLFPEKLDLLRLLRTLPIVTDGLVAVVLYGAIHRQSASRFAAVAAAVIWLFAPAPLEALANANLTNLFGQSLFALGLAGVAWMAAAGRVSWPATVAIGVALVVAFLSHFGTVTVGVAMFAAAAAALIVFGRDVARRAGVWAFAIILTAGAVSWVAYYAHFTAVYARTWTAVTSGASDDSSKIVAAPAVKLSRWWTGTGDDYGRPGVPLLLASMAGLLIAIGRRPIGGGTLVMLAWLASWIALTALGILTPVTLRANLAAAPVFACFGALACARLAGLGRAGLVAGSALAAWLTWDGLALLGRALVLSAGN